jgi:hypothetical protein
VTIETQLKFIYVLRPFQKLSHVQVVPQTETVVMRKKRLFLDRDPGHDKIPGLLGHGSKIPDRTIKRVKPTDACTKFQLSKCHRG